MSSQSSKTSPVKIADKDLKSLSQLFPNFDEGAYHSVYDINGILKSSVAKHFLAFFHIRVLETLFPSRTWISI